LEQDLKKTLKVLEYAAKNLPDKGAKLRIKVQELTQKIEEQNKKLENLAVDENLNLKATLLKDKAYNVSTSTQGNTDDDVIIVDKDALIRGEDLQPKHFGKVGLKNFQERKALTLETIEDLHDEMKERPKEDDLDEPPKYLKVQLKQHQLHALKFMRWRETQKVKGGILADDMGLG
jgi:transcription termination factor 2